MSVLNIHGHAAAQVADTLSNDAFRNQFLACVRHYEKQYNPRETFLHDAICESSPAWIPFADPSHAFALPRKVHPPDSYLNPML